MSLLGIHQVGDKFHSVWSHEFEGNSVGATVGYDGVTEIIVDKADGPMGYYAVALVYCGNKIWQILPLHMMAEIVVDPKARQ